MLKAAFVHLSHTGTFFFLHKREDSLRALENFNHHLSDGRKLMLDIFVLTELRLGNLTMKSWELHNEEVITLESRMIEVDFIPPYTVSYHRYEKWHKGQLRQSWRDFLFVGMALKNLKRF